jgi:dTDP-4-amino-4,6-dideoxygalactose transaminase
LTKLTPQIIVPFEKHYGISAAHIMPILLPTEINRVEFMDFMKANGIQTSIHYPPIHEFSFYKKHDTSFENSLPYTEDVASREVTLPMYPTLTDDDITKIVHIIQEALLIQK